MGVPFVMGVSSMVSGGGTHDRVYGVVGQLTLSHE